jgi:ATP-dependent DNA helicase RecG
LANTHQTLALSSLVSKPIQANLAKLGIRSVHDLLLHMPLRYLDETRITAIRELRLSNPALVEGEIVHAEVTYKPRKALMVRLQDDTGQLTLRFLNFYPSQVAALKEGTSRARLWRGAQWFFWL